MADTTAPAAPAEQVPRAARRSRQPATTTDSAGNTLVAAAVTGIPRVTRNGGDSARRFVGDIAGPSREDVRQARREAGMEALRHRDGCPYDGSVLLEDGQLPERIEDYELPTLPSDPINPNGVCLKVRCQECGEDVRVD